MIYKKIITENAHKRGIWWLKVECKKPFHLTPIILRELSATEHIRAATTKQQI